MCVGGPVRQVEARFGQGALRPPTSCGLRLREVLDHEHFVASLVVDELVSHLARDQHAEAARPKPHLRSREGAGHDLVGVVRSRGVLRVR